MINRTRQAFVLDGGSIEENVLQRLLDTGLNINAKLKFQDFGCYQLSCKLVGCQTLEFALF